MQSKYLQEDSVRNRRKQENRRNEYLYILYKSFYEVAMFNYLKCFNVVYNEK